MAPRPAAGDLILLAIFAFTLAAVSFRGLSPYVILQTAPGYEFGFARRGLLGFLIGRVSEDALLGMLILGAGGIVLATVMVLVLLREWSRLLPNRVDAGLIALPVLASSFTLQQWASDLGRADIWAVSALAAVAWAVIRGAWNLALGFAVASGLILALMHEGVAFWFCIASAGLLWSVAASGRQKIAALVAGAAGLAVAAFVAIRFPLKNVVTEERLLQAMEGRFAARTIGEWRPFEDFFSVDGLTDPFHPLLMHLADPRDQIAEALSRLFSLGSLTAHLWFFVLFGPVLAAAAVLLGKMIARERSRLTILGAVCLVPLLLGFVAIDYGRWWSMAFLSLTLLVPSALIARGRASEFAEAVRESRVWIAAAIVWSLAVGPVSTTLESIRWEEAKWRIIEMFSMLAG
ncbi:MAG: hypothetical protein MH204_02755 [Fimbriimonadaceae bacterium]|nr:hypothetical protein [Fimbriimonadaceae bacterium]